MTGAAVAELTILYEDNHLIALNKPAGLLTQPSGRDEDSLEARGKEWIRRTRGKTGEVFLHAVHRLDRPVSGVVLFARTGKGLTRLNEQQRLREVRKIYHAVVTADLPSREGTLRHLLRHSRMKSLPAAEQESGARACTLHYRVLKRSSGMSLVEITLETGRYHQIRAQLAACGCPVLGDHRYGGRSVQCLDGIALHHACMEFTHPTLKTRIAVEAPYPESWPLKMSGPTGNGGGQPAPEEQ
jgi:23S rRNA pseudouridine1911/1915/1917 synthase